MMRPPMKKVAIIFTVAVFLPSLVLAWLALRSLEDQQFVLERQQALLYSATAESLSREINSYLVKVRRGFTLEVEELLLKRTAGEVAPAFDELLRQRWPLAEVGFAVSADGELLAPPAGGRTEARRFRDENTLFLSNRQVVEAYALNEAIERSVFPPGDHAQVVTAQTQSQPPPSRSSFKGGKAQQLFRNVSPQNQAFSQQMRQPLPTDNLSKITLAEAEFRQMVQDARQGTIARFLQNRLNLMFWYRPPRDTNVVFGTLVNLARLTDELRPIVKLEPETLQAEICVALLDDTARPVAVSADKFRTNWKRPFVAAEIGKTLPHWELGIYLLDPNRLTESAQLVKLTLGLLILVLIAAIGVGSWLIVADLRRQLRLARQQTDFVSNVSHELKTPLTSIRMFSELLEEGGIEDPEKQRSFLRIIAAEAARLTRLINNVLDFSRLERGEKHYNFARCDLVALVCETLNGYRPHLETARFTLEFTMPGAPLIVHGDHDALAQVLVNLLSNTEKYSGERREIRVDLRVKDEPLPHVELRVLDRGIGVPKGCETKIFEKFYRAHDSLSSGVQGSGLGLTLARQIARAHGGEVTYEPREGGGSCFALLLPLPPQSTAPEPTLRADAVDGLADGPAPPAGHAP
jgi:signal transduction histidine kinase